MKKNVKTMLFARRRKIRWDDEYDHTRLNQRMVLEAWPDLNTCVQLYYRLCPTLRLHNEKNDQPALLECASQFIRSLNKHCTIDTMKLQVIDALTKLCHRIPSVGLGDAPIKEKTGLYHFRVSYFWRIFYRRTDRAIFLLEFCPHKKQAHSRRLDISCDQQQP